ncbi:MAG: insulinase family protein [Anaerolineales bacterium]|nr:insulinase family protein [Anaerolineales bacterium]MCW5855605.1 insulinase family protein [Anaerolineales bacterium]
MSPARNSIPGSDDITRVELANGIVVLARHNPNSPAITLRGYLQAGSLFDPDEKLGLADFTADALMHGAGGRSFQEIYDSLESIGASFGFNSGTHTTSFGGKSLAEDLPLLLDILNSSLRTPAFPADQVQKLRAQLLTGLALRAQDTREMASLVFDELVYRGHPYSRPDDGNVESISAIVRDDLAAFHQQVYGPRGMVVAVVGGVPAEQAVEQLRAALEDWTNPQQPAEVVLPPWQPLPERLAKRHEIPGMIQSDLIVGTAGPPRRSPDFMAANLGNSVLGRFGLMGRIGDAVREKAGLAYYAASGVGGGLGPGAWEIYAGVNPANEQKAVDLILQEIQRFTTELVSEEELSDSQSNFIGSMPLSLESNGGVAEALLNMERYQLGLDHYRLFPDKVRAVTREQVRDVAVKYLPADQLAVAIAGPPLES